MLITDHWTLARCSLIFVSIWMEMHSVWSTEMEAIRAEYTCVLLAVVFRMHSLMSHNEVSDPAKLGKSQAKRTEKDDIY